MARSHFKQYRKFREVSHGKKLTHHFVIKAVWQLAKALFSPLTLPTLLLAPVSTELSCFIRLLALLT